ncbi:phage tail tape measure protein [Lacticaseibacillus paracasei]|uniref:phage tail tape measure protein n=1 Tax=Lacticaseibacillus paracasei TaxID=1597 RepID=UPI001E42B5CF|nr:phage tail tape measure protein [Lacticaseibacillus paracasei]
MANDGSVKIDVQLLTNEANAKAQELKATLKGVEVNPEASTSAKKLDQALKDTSKSGKDAADATKKLSQSENESVSSTEKATRAAEKQKAAQDSLKASLQSQSAYWSHLAEGQEAVGLKVSASVSRFNSLKAQLAQTNIQVEQARTKFDQLSRSEDANEKETQEAANAYQELIGKQTGLALQVGNMQQKIGNLTPTMAAAADKADMLGDRFQSVGAKLSAFGQKATIGLTMPIVAGLGYAAKAAVSFDSQIKSMGSLLDDGTISAKTLQAQLNGLGDASKRWAVQYGVSTTEINNGMSELIKKGYSYNQVLGAMPSILDAARASGDDFNTVMSVSTSTLEQFGLKSNNTAQMLKNTQRVTDDLTYVANATSSGFSDLGLAMQYVGPVAHGMGMSLEETAAILGNLSQQGIEGEKAGTGLRSVLSSLTVQSGQAAPAMKKLGVNVEAFKKGTIGLPEVIDQIQKNTAGWADAEKAAVMQQAFGIDGQSAMNILVNEGSDSLRKLTKDTQNATGYTKKLAETMNNTSAANVEKFKQSLNVLAINMGSKLLPTITDLVKEGTKLVDWFSKLDDGTQKMIIKSAIAVAALGPVVGTVGKLTSGVGALFHAGSGAIQFLGRFGGGAKVAADQTGVLKDATGQVIGTLEKAAPAVGKSTGLLRTMGSALVTTGEGAGALGFALTPLGIGVVAVTAAVGLGVAAWELWGKEAVASADRASRWGTDIGEAADKSAGKMQDASGRISGAFTDTNHTVKENAKTIVKGFDDMTKAAKQAADESDAAAKKLAKSLGGSAGEALLKAAAKEKTANDKRIQQMKDNAAQAEQITKAANKSGEALTVDQIQLLDNLRRNSAAQAVKTLKLSGSEQTNVLKAINGEKITMSKAAAQQQYENMQNALQQEYQANSKAQHDIKTNALLSTSEKNAALAGLEQDHQTRMKGIYAAAIQAMKVQGLSNHQIQEQLQTDFDLTANQAKKAMKSYSDAMNKGVKDSKQFAAVVSNEMSKSVQKAGSDWNNLVLDPKTGKVKTNLPEVLKDTANTEDGWKRLKFDLKNAKITSNAKQMIVEAMASTEKWKSMDVPEKNAIIRASGREELADIMTKFVSWNKFDLKDQQAIVKGDYTPLVSALIKSGDWNNLKLKEKQAIVHDKATTPIVDALAKTGEWDKLDLKVQTALVNVKGKEELQDVLFNLGAWNGLDVGTKYATLQTWGKQDLADIIDQLKLWDQITPKQMEAVVKGDYSSLVAAIDQVDGWNRLDTKQLEIMVKDKATVPLIEAMEETGKWNGLSTEAKTAVMQTKGKAELADMVIKYGAWDSLPDSTKRLLMNDADARAKLEEAGLAIDKYNLFKNPNEKGLKADNSDVVSKTEEAGRVVTNYNGIFPDNKPFTGDASSVNFAALQGQASINDFNIVSALPKPFTGDASSVNFAAGQGKASIAGFNDTNPQPKPFTGDSSNVVNAAGSGKSATIGFNLQPVSPKTYTGVDHASGPANAATRASSEFHRQTDHKVTFTTIWENITKTISKVFTGHEATGTDYFPGGFAMVNDQVGPTFREMVQLPTGLSFIPHGRNQVLSLPRGSKVLPARETAQKFPGLPQFKDGLNASSIKMPKFANGLNARKLSDFSPVFAMPPEQASSFEERTTTVEMALNSESSKVLQNLTNTMSEMQAMFSKVMQGVASASPVVAEIHVHAQLDKRELTREMADPIRVQIDQLNKIRNYRKGEL